MKKIDFVKKARKLYKTYAFNFFDGQNVYPELFLRLNLIQKTEYSILCDKLLETPEFQYYLGLDGNTEEDIFEEIPDKFEENCNINLYSKDSGVPLPVPVYDKILLRIFDNACFSMEKDGYLNGINLPLAMRIIAMIIPVLNLKSYECATWSYDIETQYIVQEDIKKYNNKNLSSLTSCEKASLLSSIIYATTWDLEQKNEFEKADNLQTELTEILSGLPEYFYADIVENINYLYPLNKIKNGEENAICQNIRCFMANRLKHFFKDEELTLHQMANINNNIYQIKNLFFDSPESWKSQIHPLIKNINKSVPFYLKKYFRICIIGDLNQLFQVVETTDLTQKNWLHILANHFSKCFSFHHDIREKDAYEKMKSLQKLANISVMMNPFWTAKDKDVFWDVIWKLHIDYPSVILKHKTNKRKDKGRSYE